MAKIPGTKPREKTDPLLPPVHGIGSNGGPEPQMTSSNFDSGPPQFGSDHQLSVPDDGMSTEREDHSRPLSHVKPGFVPKFRGM